MQTHKSYADHFADSVISKISWLAMLYLTIATLMIGVYKGPVEISRHVYPASVVKFQTRSYRGFESTVLYIQGEQKLRHIAFAESDIAYPDFLRYVRSAEHGDSIIVHSISSNYGSERAWMIERGKHGVAFATSEERMQQEISEVSAKYAEQRMKLTGFFLAAIILFPLREYYGYRRRSEREIVDRVIYKASRGTVLYFGAVVVVVLFAGIYLAIEMVNQRIPLNFAAKLLLFLTLPLPLAGIGYLCWLMKGIKHDLVLDRSGLHYADLARDYGVEYIPWKNMQGSKAISGGIVIVLKQPLASGADTITVLPIRLAATACLASDVEKGIAGELFAPPGRVTLQTE